MNGTPFSRKLLSEKEIVAQTEAWQIGIHALKWRLKRQKTWLTAFKSIGPDEKKIKNAKNHLFLTTTRYIKRAQFVFCRPNCLHQTVKKIKKLKKNIIHRYKCIEITLRKKMKWRFYFLLVYVAIIEIIISTEQERWINYKKIDDRYILLIHRLSDY